MNKVLNEKHSRNYFKHFLLSGKKCKMIKSNFWEKLEQSRSNFGPFLTNATIGSQNVLF